MNYDWPNLNIKNLSILRRRWRVVCLLEDDEEEEEKNIGNKIEE